MVQKGHTNTNPQPGQYLTHARSYITRAVTALIGAHQRGKPLD